MPHEFQLPMLDITSFLTSNGDESQRKEAAATLDKYLTSYGFLYLTGFDSLVSQQELDAVLEVSRAFFARPEQEKAACKIQRGDGARGWQKMHENVTNGLADHQEGWDGYKSFPAEDEDPTKLLHGPNRWPAEPSDFRHLLETHFKKMEILGHALMEATAMALGMQEGDEDYARLKDWVSDPFWYVRCIGYPPLPATAEGVSCGAHKDYGNWTLLLADPTPGALQVFLRDPEGCQTADAKSSEERGYWINADPKPGCLVVNVGEMVEVYSAGRYKATLHRVIHKAPTYRVSVPFFYEPNFDATITPLASAAAANAQERPAPAYTTKEINPVRYGDFLTAKVSKNFKFEDL
ncbi:hypothetical protein JCM10908_005214 [Rhodotorula pacifica]|uniref:isopenicillin N synthase family dioxygenase n=1 Tax=Rhodotorula pacifica TaxID=1495444 RepID=UPI003174CF0E